MERSRFNRGTLNPKLLTVTGTLIVPDFLSITENYVMLPVLKMVSAGNTAETLPLLPMFTSEQLNMCPVYYGNL